VKRNLEVGKRRRGEVRKRGEKTLSKKIQQFEVGEEEKEGKSEEKKERFTD